MAQQQVNEYDALNFEGMERRANYRVIAFREDIYHALGRDRAKATVFNIIYRWQEYLRDQIIAKNTDRAKLGKPLFTDEEVYEQMWVKMSPYDFSRETGGSISHSTMRAAALALVKDGVLIIKQTGCQEDGNLAYHYQINKKVIAEKLDAIPVYPPKVTRAKSGTGTDTPTNPDTPRTKRGTGYTKSGTDPVLNAARTPYQSGYAPRTNSGTHYSNNSSDSENRDITASFLGERESSPDPVEQSALPEKKEESSIAYSQDTHTPTTDSSRLQENKAHQSIDILTSQESVTLPAKPAPIAEYKPEPPAPRLQTPAQIAQERKRIERHIWQLIDTAAGAKIGRSYTKPMEDLVTGYMDGEYLDEDFTQAVLLTKEKKQQLKFTNIVDNMADAALKRKKIIDFQTAATKKNNIDEEIEASRRAEKEFEAKERARKEQGKVFA